MKMKSHIMQIKILIASVSNENTGFPIRSGMTLVFDIFNMLKGKAKTVMNTILHLYFPLFFVARNG